MEASLRTNCDSDFGGGMQTILVECIPSPVARMETRLSRCLRTNFGEFGRGSILVKSSSVLQFKDVKARIKRWMELWREGKFCGLVTDTET